MSTENISYMEKVKGQVELTELATTIAAFITRRRGNAELARVANEFQSLKTSYHIIS